MLHAMNFSIKATKFTTLIDHCTTDDICIDYLGHNTPIAITFSAQTV